MATAQPTFTFIVYVTDAQASAAIYRDLLDLPPAFESPRFMSLALPGGVQLALWSGSEIAGDLLSSPETTRTSELCLSLGATGEIDSLHENRRSRGVRIVTEPYNDVFGRTFVAADPDGNLIRVAPMD